MKAFLFISISLLFSLDVFCQISFNRTYGSFGVDKGANIVQSADSKYYIVGSTSSSSTGDTDILLLCIDENGNELWAKHFGTGQIDKGTDIAITADNHLIVLGYSNGEGSNGSYDTYILKLTMDGTLVETHYFGGSDWDFAYDMEMDGDGNLFIIGETYSDGMGNNDAFLLKLDANFNTLWYQTYGSSGNELGRNVIVDSDGNILFIGDQKLLDEDLYHAWMVKTDANGEIIWQFSHSTIDDVDEYGSDLLIRDGSIFGLSRLPDNATIGTTSYYWRMNNPDDIEWDHTMNNTIMYGLLNKNDDAYVVLGQTYWNNAFWFYFSNGGWPVFANDGYQEFDVNFELDRYYNAINTQDGGFIAVGESVVDDFGQYSVFVTKFDSMLLVTPDVSIGDLILGVDAESRSSFGVYPNPTQRYVQIDGSARMNQYILIRDLTGRIVGENHGLQNKIDLNYLTPNIYFIELYEDDTYLGTQKIVVQ